MLLRRLAFAIINWLLAAALTVIIVLLIGVVIGVLDIHTEPVRTSLFPFWLFVFLVAVFDSSILGNGFLGGRITGIRVESTQDRLLSIIGTFARASIVILIPSLFVPPLLSSFLYESGFSRATYLDRPFWIASATTALLIPCSLIYTNGRIGIHDLILGVRVISIASSPCRTTYTHSKLIALATLMAFVTSVVAHAILTEAGLIKRTKWEMQALVPMIEGAMVRSRALKSSRSTEPLEDLQADLQSLGYRVSNIGFHYQSDHITKGLPSTGVSIVTNDMFMSVSRMKDLSAVVRSKLIIRGVDGREPTLVRISRRVSFAAMMFEWVDSFVVFGQSVEQVLAGYALDPTAALCCGNEELYLKGD